MRWGGQQGSMINEGADISHGAANILPGMATILSSVLDILQVQHQFFVFWSFQGEKLV